MPGRWTMPVPGAAVCMRMADAWSLPSLERMWSGVGRRAVSAQKWTDLRQALKRGTEKFLGAVWRGIGHSLSSGSLWF